MVPVFAIAFRFLPHGFSQSSIRKEKPYLDDQAAQVLEVVKAAAVDQRRLLKSDVNYVEMNDGWRMDLSKCDFWGLDYSEDDGQSSFFLRCTAHTAEPRKQSASFDFEVSMSTPQETFSDGTVRLVVLAEPHEPVAVADTYLPNPTARQVFNGLGVGFIPDGDFDSGSLFLTPDQERIVERWESALNGDPTSAPGTSWRMLYLSVTVITTLGFGDIVPITTAARLLVSAEAILGVVVIGLFLNALARTFNRAR
jgi:hypothetical protein